MKIDLYFVFLPVLLCTLLYFYNEKNIDKLDAEMKNFLLANKDDDISSKFLREKLTINKVTILLDKFYSTNEPKYISYALRLFIIKITFILAIVFGVTIAIFSCLVCYF